MNITPRAGFVPVLDEVANAGAEPADLRRVSLTLDDMLRAFDGDVYNAVTKTTVVEYSGLLWSAPTIPPGGSARGLLFFRKKAPDWDALRLKARLPG